jgi:superfamily II DNA helicase RecQ
MGIYPHRRRILSMQMAFFAIPARGDNGLQESLNAFLRSHRVLTVHREFVGQGDNSFWALTVEYLEGAAPTGSSGSSRSSKPRVDYKEVLSPDDFAVFAKLREWRKATAEQEGIPVYAVLTNEQLAAIATNRPSSAAALKDVEGIGDGKAGKYGEGVLAVVTQPREPSSKSATATPQDGTEPAPPGESRDEARR